MANTLSLFRTADFDSRCATSVRALFLGLSNIEQIAGSTTAPRAK
jgi:hypothetical protein